MARLLTAVTTVVMFVLAALFFAGLSVSLFKIFASLC